VAVESAGAVGSAAAMAAAVAAAVVAVAVAAHELAEWILFEDAEQQAAVAVQEDPVASPIASGCEEKKTVFLYIRFTYQSFS